MRPAKIILISIDTLRADHLGCYGYKRNTSPTLDKFAEDGVLFRYAFSPASHTIPVHGSIFTSKYPSSHSIGFNQTIEVNTGSLDTDQDITLAEILNTLEYKTAAFVSGIVLRKDTNLNAGFGVYNDNIDSDPCGRRDGLKTNQCVFRWLDDHVQNDFFLFIHYFDVHGPYISPHPYRALFPKEDYGQRLLLNADSDHHPTLSNIPVYQILNPIRDENGRLISFETDVRYYLSQYDGVVRYCDDIVNNLFNKLKEFGIYDDSLIIVTADHGEALGENNVFFYHGLTVTPDQISIPLILKPHRGWEIKPHAVTIPVSSLDITPTILSLCDYDYRTLAFQGHSLKTAIEGKDDAMLTNRRIISENEGQVAFISPDLVLEIRKKELPTSTYYPSISGLSDFVDGKKFRCNTGYEHELTLPFDQYQRYRVVADIVNKYRPNTGRFKILEIGAGFEENLKKFLPKDDIYFVDKDYPEEYKQSDHYIAADITKSDLEGEYDIVISIDCYEHIPPVFREIYIRRLVRLSRVATIIAAPFESADVRESEIMANELYKQIHGKDHRWLQEHIQNGLPSLSDTIRVIGEQGMKHTIIPNGYLPRWFDMISVYLIVEGKGELAKFVRGMGEFYNDKFYRYDNMNPAYRQVVVVSKTLEIPDFQDILSSGKVLEKDFAARSSLLRSYLERFRDLCNTNLTGTRRLEGVVREKGVEVESLRAGLAKKEREVVALNETLSQRDSKVREKDASISRLEGLFKEKDTHMSTLEAIITEKNATLSRIYDSHGWKALLAYYRIRNKILPRNTWREKTAKSIWNIFRRQEDPRNKGPERSGSVATPRNRLFVAQQPVCPDTVDVGAVPRFTIRDIRPLEFPVFYDYKVSIIIPVWNKWRYTYKCFSSLLENTQSVPYEIITVDDGSSDETSQMLSKVKHISLVRNEKNLGFSKACNEGARQAKGDYLLFLNNDTEVLKGWLSAMVKLIDADEAIGAVGGKLILSDGTLQEAGSIIWSDGSTLGYGRGRNPDDPEFSYIRNVDYCSAACLLIRKELFLRLGGFDEIYSPAYYEDADLCLGVKSLGYRVVFHPGARVIHHEFGTSPKAKSIQLSLMNRSKFVEKWINTLKNHYAPKLENIMLARNSCEARRVVVMDDIIPASHLGSGFQRINVLLKYLAELGYMVTFFPLSNAFPYQPYTTELQLIGIEVYYGEALDVRRFMEERKDLYDLVIISRPHNASRFLKGLREYFTHAFIIYDGEAIYATREIARLKLTGKTPTKEEERRMILQELEPMGYADAIIGVSEYEKKRIEAFGCRNIFVWGYPLELHPPQKTFPDRKDLLFVGGFLQSPTPNEDAMLHFTREIFPRVRQVLRCQLLIVGTNLLESIRNLKSDAVTVTGYVDNLREYYEYSRIFVVPTRFAAGIPLKLLEAMSHGIPAVVSPLMAEQLRLSEGEGILIGKDDKDFAEKIIRLYQDQELWQTLQKKELDFIRDQYNPKEMKQTLAKFLEEGIKGREKPGHRQNPIGRIKEHWGREAGAWHIGRGLSFVEHEEVQKRFNKKVTGNPYQDPHLYLMEFMSARGYSFPVERCLTLGCGSGDLERGFSKYNFCLRHDAFDIAEKAIEKALSNAREQNLTHIHYQVKDLNDLDLPANTYDVIFGSSSIHHIAELEHLFSEVHKALKKNGIFFLNEYIGPSRFQWTHKQLEVVNAILRILPAKYKRIVTDPSVMKETCGKPTIEEVMAVDPSEAVRSAEIVPLLYQYFDILEIKNKGGAILHPLLANIVGNFKSDSEVDLMFLRTIFDLEDVLMELGDLASDFAMIIARKRNR